MFRVPRWSEIILSNSDIQIINPPNLFDCKIDKKPKIERRYKALYSPLKNQMKDKKVKKFIKMRANPKFAFKVAKI